MARKVLVAGSGGREHALGRALLRSPQHPEVIAAPGNAGIARDRVECAPVAADDVGKVVALARAREKIERAHAPTTTIGKGGAHLCIADPMGRAVSSREGWLADRLATHPPMAIRVSRLRAMAYQEIKHSGGVVGGDLPTAAPRPTRPAAI